MKRKVLKLGNLEKKPEIIEEEISHKNTEDKKKFFEYLEISTSLGFSISVPIAGGTILGAYLDKVFRTSPKLTLSLLFLGIIIGFLNIYHILKEK